MEIHRKCTFKENMRSILVTFMVLTSKKRSLFQYLPENHYSARKSEVPYFNVCCGQKQSTKLFFMFPHTARFRYKFSTEFLSFSFFCKLYQTNFHATPNKVPSTAHRPAVPYRYIVTDCKVFGCFESFIGNFQIPTLCLSSVFLFSNSQFHSLHIPLAHTRYGQSYHLQYVISPMHSVAVCPPNTVTNFNYTKELAIIILFLGERFFKY